MSCHLLSIRMTPSLPATGRRGINRRRGRRGEGEPLRHLRTQACRDDKSQAGRAPLRLASRHSSGPGQRRARMGRRAQKHEAPCTLAVLDWAKQRLRRARCPCGCQLQNAGRCPKCQVCRWCSNAPQPRMLAKRLQFDVAGGGAQAVLHLDGFADVGQTHINPGLLDPCIGGIFHGGQQLLILLLRGPAR